jgi:hypothetical protein
MLDESAEPYLTDGSIVKYGKDGKMEEAWTSILKIDENHDPVVQYSKVKYHTVAEMK